MPFAFSGTGVSRGTAQKKFIAMRATKSGACFVSRMESVLPLAWTPEAVFAFLLTMASAPTMSPMKATEGEASPGFRSRLITFAKVCAVTSSPVLNLNPGRIVNV